MSEEQLRGYQTMPPDVFEAHQRLMRRGSYVEAALIIAPYRIPFNAVEAGMERNDAFAVLKYLRRYKGVEVYVRNLRTNEIVEGGAGACATHVGRNWSYERFDIRLLTSDD